MSKEKTTEPTTDHVTTQGIQIKVASKVCGKCKRELPSKDFWGSRSSKDGLQGACKDCQLETPLGTHTTKVGEPTPIQNARVSILEGCKGSGMSYAALVGLENATPKKRARPSRAHPIGSGHRKECVKCKYHMTSINDDPCINAAAITDEKNQAKVCPYKE